MIKIQSLHFRKKDLFQGYNWKWNCEWNPYEYEIRKICDRKRHIADLTKKKIKPYCIFYNDFKNSFNLAEIS